MEIDKIIMEKLKKQLIPPRLLLGKFRFVDESARYTNTNLDHLYLPFYYYLGTLLQPKSMVELGIGSGLCSSFFFLGCKSVDNFIAFQDGDTYTPNIAIGNIKTVYRNQFLLHVGKIHDKEFVDKIGLKKHDLFFLNGQRSYDDYLLWLNLAWDNLNYDGYICIDYLTWDKKANQAYSDFCKLKQRPEMIIKTRFGIGLIKR